MQLPAPCRLPGLPPDQQQSHGPILGSRTPLHILTTDIAPRGCRQTRGICGYTAGVQTLGREPRRIAVHHRPDLSDRVGPPAVSACRVGDSAPRGAVAGSAPRLRRRAASSSPLPPWARSGCVGCPVGGSAGCPGLCGVEDRGPPSPGPSPGRRHPGRQSANGAHPRGRHAQWHRVADAPGRPVRLGLTPGGPERTVHRPWA